MRLRPTYRGHVWSYDFVQDRPHDGTPFRMLVVIDEHSRECLAIEVDRKLNAQRVLETLADLFVGHGLPEHIRSDNGPEFIAIAVRSWLGRLGVKTLFIEPGSPRENGYCESFNGKLRDELLNRGDLLHAEGSAGAHRVVASPLQPAATTLIARLQATRARRYLAARPGPDVPSTRVGHGADLTTGT